MIAKVLIRITVLITIFTINMCGAYQYDYEPELINSDFRLAAMGNLDLVIIHWDNEINAYDFGESPAGVIEDNSGKSMVYVPCAYGFTQFDSFPHHEWSGYALTALSIVKIRSKFATGFTYSKKRTDNIYEYGLDYREGTIYDSHIGSFMTAYKVLSSFVLGFSGSYSKRTKQYQYIDEYYHDIYSYEPSVLIQPAQLHWQFGLNYKLRKPTLDPAIHDFTLPIIYSSTQLRIGIKGGLGTIPYDGPARKSLKLRSIYRILSNNHSVNIGAYFGYTNPLFWEEFLFSWWNGWETNFGIGIAYQHENFGLIGLQYNRNIRKTKTSWEWEEYSYTIHEHYINFGAEILFFRSIPLRIGYVNMSYDYPYDYYNDPAYDIITAGFGVRIPKAKLEIDFAYNVKFIDRGGEYWEGFIDKDHIFGFSGRFIF